MLRRRPFTHWVVYNIPAGTSHIEENIPQQATVAGLGVQGKNDAGEIGYMGPCPPSGTHRYFARLFAVDRELDLKPGLYHRDVYSEMQGHIVEQAELMGTYAKKCERAA